jgi:hypothetical protein
MTRLRQTDAMIARSARRTTEAEPLVRLAMPAAAKKTGVAMSGVATYQTALPDAKLIRARLEHFAWPSEDADE